MKIVMSSGHGKYIRGAAGPEPWGLDEVDEARKVVEETAKFLRAAGHSVTTLHDDVSDNQSDNLDWIVDHHNAQGPHDLDVSIHFNCYNQTAHGCEVLYVSDSGFEVADRTVDEICIASGLTNRGPKERTDLAFLNGTNETAVLVETCFCDNRDDCDIYRQKFEAICEAIAAGLVGDSEEEPDEPDWPDRPDRPPPLNPNPPDGALFYAKGTCSWFGGPEDSGVASDEGLAFIYELDDAPHLFLPYQPSGTSGLARRLDTDRVFYIACRWDYEVTSKDYLRNQTRKALVRSLDTGKEFYAFPADWGPHEQQTGRAADLSRCLMEALGITTDDEVEVIYPADI